MSTLDYLKTYQPIIYNTFYNAFTTNKLSHAYILCGEMGTPLLHIAKFLAKSIVCDNPNPFACEECITCQRVEDGNYPDIHIVGDDAPTIKKDDIKEIESSFQRSSIEKKGIMIYILHQVENMTSEAVNSLLKFLEEPESGIYAILTTQNEAKVLPTILSRCQKLRVLLVDRQEVIDKAIALGVEDSDAQILSFFVNEPELVLKEAKEDDYQVSKKCVDELLDSLMVSKNEGIYVMQKTVSAFVKDKNTARYFLDILSLVFKDLVNYFYKNRVMLSHYDNIFCELSKKLSHLEETLVMIMDARGQIEVNVTIPLLLDHVIYEIVR